MQTVCESEVVMLASELAELRSQLATAQAGKGLLEAAIETELEQRYALEQQVAEAQSALRIAVAAGQTEATERDRWQRRARAMWRQAQRWRSAARNSYSFDQDILRGQIEQQGRDLDNAVDCAKGFERALAGARAALGKADLVGRAAQAWQAA